MYVLPGVWMLVLTNHPSLSKGHMFWITGCGLYEPGSHVCEFLHHSPALMLSSCWCPRVSLEYPYVEGCKTLHHLIIGTSQQCGVPCSINLSTKALVSIMTGILGTVNGLSQHTSRLFDNVIFRIIQEDSIVTFLND